MTSSSRQLPRRLLAAALFAALAAVPGGSARGDGGVHLGTTTLLSSGDTADKIDLVFLGDGFTNGQQAAYNARVDQAVAAFLGAHPLQALRGAFNIHRVNISSPESGTDKFATCNSQSTGDSNQSRRTALDSGYCNGGGGRVNRCMGSSNHALARGFAGNAPDDDIVIALVNDSGHGGCAFGDLTYFTLTSRFADIVVHELGHAIFDLADEYPYDGPDRYTGGEPRRVNVTTNTNRATLKWRDLVLSSTALPTQSHPDCSNPSIPGRNVDADLVGAFEAADYSRCDVYRPQHTCRMRESNQQFCSVCRRKIIRDLEDNLGADRAVFFRNLLVRDDQDGWLRGAGDIYMNYFLRSRGQRIDGRWPASGDSSFDSGDSKTLDVLAGVVPPPAAGTSASLEVRLRDADWPDGDDTLSSDATINLPASGNYTVDRSDYRLRGEVRSADLRVLLDVLNVKDDQDGFFAGAGDIYVNYTISNGSQSVTGRWPTSGTRGMNDHDSAYMSTLAATIPPPTGSSSLTVRVRVMDEDSFFTGSDDLVGSDTFVFNSAQEFGATATTHVRDRGNYRLTLSVAKRR